MKDDLNEKEKSINETFQQFEPFIDAEKMWNAIEDRLPQKKKKRRPLFWLFFFAGIISVGSYLFISKLDQQKVDTVLSNDLTKDIQERIVDNKYTPTGNNHSDHIQTEILNVSPQNEKTFANHKSFNSNIDAVNNHVYKEHQIDLRSQINRVGNNQRLETLSYSTLNSLQEVTKKNLLNSITLMPPRGSSLISDERPSELSINPVRDKNWKPFISGAFGIHLIHNQFTSSSEVITTQFNQEKSLPSFYGNIQVGLEHKGGWKFSGGIYYLSQFARSTEEQTVNQVMDNEGIVTIYIDDLGNRTTENGQLAVNTIRRFEAQRIRSHQFLGLQIGINREVWKSRPFSIDVGLASMIDIWSMHRGYILTEEGLSNIPDEPFYSSRRWSIMPQINLWYTHRKWSVGVSPYLIYSNDFLVSQDQPYKIKNSQYGIQLSLMYQP